MANSYEITFTRIGRKALQHKEVFEANNLQELSEEVYAFCLKFLCSRWFDVSIYPDNTGFIGGGRFGSFIIQPYEVQNESPLF